MCACLQVSSSGYYGWKSRGKEKVNQQLRTHIRAIHRESRGTYGSLRITRSLQKMGISVGHNKAARIMREEGRYGIPRKRPKCWQQGSRSTVTKNLLNRDFSAYTPNQVWVGDITYVSTPEGWLYAGVLLDLYSRRAVGLACSSRMDTSLPLKALDQAIALRQPPQGLIDHSDRGSQYTSTAYGAKLDSARLCR